MAYQVLALKYRPRTFEQVVGQRSTVTTLQNALRESRIAHGYIFSGVRGVGKTSLARIFAKALNCARGPTPEPCGECDSCREIVEGRSLDVFEIDGASNSGVDKMRELLEMVRYTPARDRYKVFIIDEFHQISRSAFNALLKTLEEPPPHVVFIMATTELGKVLPTIQSRCQQFDLRRILPSEIATQLRAIASAEGITIGDRTLVLLARSAGGSMRDALTAMDQVIAACGKDVADEEARAVLGVIPEEEVEAFFSSLAGRDAPALLRLIAHVSDGGYDLVAFGAEIYHAARRLLLARTLPDAADVLDLSAEEAERARQLAQRFGEDELLRVFTGIEDIQSALRYSTQPRFLLEATAVRLARLGDLVPLGEIIARLDSLGATAFPPASPLPSPSAAASSARTIAHPPVATRSVPPPAPATIKKKLQEAAGAAEGSTGSLTEPGEPGPLTEPSSLTGSASRTGALLPPEAGLFEKVLTRLEGENPALASSLAMAVRPAESEGSLVLPYQERSTWRRRVEEPVNLQSIARLASEIAGRPIHVRTTTAPAGSGRSATAGPPGPAARSGGPGAPGAGPMPKPLAERALSDPIVRTVVDVFRARLLDIQEK